METRKIIEKAINHYACLQKEDYYIEFEDRKYIAIKWRISMDRFVNLKRVKQIATYFRKNDIQLPIYDSFMNEY